jgi:hypothetical protein
MGKLERFLRLERERPDRKDAVGSGKLDRFRDPPAEPPDDDGAPPSGPLFCMRCEAENNAGAKRCFNCDAELDTPEMRAHQKRARARSAARAEQQRREALEAADRMLEAQRRESAANRVPSPWSEDGATVPGQAPDLDFGGVSPLAWLVRSLSVIEDPWLRVGARVALIGAFVALLWYSLSSPGRYPLFVILLLLLGGGGLRGRRWRRRQWWR